MRSAIFIFYILLITFFSCKKEETPTPDSSTPVTNTTSGYNELIVGEWKLDKYYTYTNHTSTVSLFYNQSYVTELHKNFNPNKGKLVFTKNSSTLYTGHLICSPLFSIGTGCYDQSSNFSMGWSYKVIDSKISFGAYSCDILTLTDEKLVFRNTTNGTNGTYYEYSKTGNNLTTDVENKLFGNWNVDSCINIVYGKMLPSGSCSIIFNNVKTESLYCGSQFTYSKSGLVNFIDPYTNVISSFQPRIIQFLILTNNWITLDNNLVFLMSGMVNSSTYKIEVLSDDHLVIYEESEFQEKLYLSK